MLRPWGVQRAIINQKIRIPNQLGPYENKNVQKKNLSSKGKSIKFKWTGGLTRAVFCCLSTMVPEAAANRLNFYFDYRMLGYKTRAVASKPMAHRW